MAILTTADKAFMAAANNEVIADYGTTGSFERGRRDANGQVSSWVTFLTSQKVSIQPAGPATLAVVDAPAGSLFDGVLNTPGTAIQNGDRYVTGSTRYVVVGTLPLGPTVELQLTKEDAFTNG